METHQRDGEPLPWLPGYGCSFAAPRPATAAATGRGGVVQQWADQLAARVEGWRSRPADGVQWVRVLGVLSEPLSVGVCYLAPKRSGGAPADEDSWWLHLAQEVAEAEAAGLVILAGDFNARTRMEADWQPGTAGCGPRISADRAPPNSYGHQFLLLCRSSTLRMCNGRGPGSSSGEATSYGTAGGGSAVVDYFAISERLLPDVLQMQVAGLHPAACLSDHAVLHLELALPPQQGRGQPQPQPAAAATAAGATQQRRFRLDPAKLEEAVKALQGMVEGLEGAAVAAASATTVDDMAAAAECSPMQMLLLASSPHLAAVSSHIASTMAASVPKSAAAACSFAPP